MWIFKYWSNELFCPDYNNFTQNVNVKITICLPQSMLENNDDDTAAVDDDDANKLTLPRAFTRSSMCLGQFLTLLPT